MIQARVTSGGKTSAMIMAEDKATGLLLRADIIIDRIDSLRIVTKTHELYLEETPEKFEVRAYDEHGNEFSSLEGIKFRWTIESGGGTGRATDILRFMSWQDSPYNTVPILEQLEAQGFQGHKVLLEGIKTGSAKVSVKLVDSQHSSVAPAVEPLMVVANLFLVPGSASLLPCASLQLEANQFKSNKLVPVSLPSPNHQLTVDPSLASLQPNSARLTASSELGVGLVELLDRNVGPGEMVKTPTSELRVVLPAALELNCLPHKSWTVMEGTEVAVTVTILDEENNQIYSSDNLMMEVEVDSEMFEVKERLTNGSLILGVPVKPGTAEVTARLLGAGDCQLASPLTTTARLEVVPRMVLEPQESFLPWDPVTQTQHLVQHRLLGGSGRAGELSWSSSNSSVASTTQVIGQILSFHSISILVSGRADQGVWGRAGSELRAESAEPSQAVPGLRPGGGGGRHQPGAGAVTAGVPPGHLPQSPRQHEVLSWPDLGLSVPSA